MQVQPPVPSMFSGVNFSHIWDLNGSDWQGGVFTASHLFPCLPGKALGWWMLTVSSSSPWVHVGSFFMLVNALYTLLFLHWLTAPSDFTTVVCLFFVLCVTCKTVFAFFPRLHPSDEQLLTDAELLQRGAPVSSCICAFRPLQSSHGCAPLCSIFPREIDSSLPERATCCYLLVIHVTIGAWAYGCTKLSKKQKRIR